MLLAKPTHCRYAFSYLNHSQYLHYARGYSSAKRKGSRGIYLWASGMGVWGIVREAATGEIKRYGKKKIATVCLSAGPVVTLVTNSSKVIGAATRVHSLVSFACHDHLYSASLRVSTVQWCSTALVKGFLQWDLHLQKSSV